MMRLGKTAKAQSALLERPADIGVLERRVLILSDGQRDDHAIATLLGEGVIDALRRLLREEYLVDLDALAQRKRTIGASQSAHASVAVATDLTQTTQLGVSSATTTLGTRRSLVAAKMYMLDMLQLQRGAEAAVVTDALRLRRDPDDVLAALLAALSHMQARTTESYSRRVADRLGEVLPEEYLPQYRIYRDALFEAP